MADELDPAALAGALQSLARWAEANAPAPASPLAERLRAHLGADPAELPVVSEALSPFDRVNLQLALDAWAARPGRTSDVIGLSVERGYRYGLAELLRPEGLGPLLRPGPVEHKSVEVGDRSVVVVESALFLLTDGERPLLLNLRSDDDMGEFERLELEVIAPEREAAEGLLAELRELRAELNVYRGKVIEIESGQSLRVRALPPIERGGIVLPEGVLERIERHTVGFARHADALRAAGRHIKRGLLLHGPPGTGKTLTIMYLATLMPDRTVVLVTGHSLYVLGPAIRLARELQPATVVLEDIDLVALDRYEDESNSTLVELLNEMEGLQEDSDVIFVLTTNRPKVLEPALASRPGRIDQAIELPLPDADARRRLLELYADGLHVPAPALDGLVHRTDGVSPAFIRELLRRGALLAAEDGDATRVTAKHLDEALKELQEVGGALTRRLLGFAAPGDEEELLDAGDDLDFDDDFD